MRLPCRSKAVWLLLFTKSIPALIGNQPTPKHDQQRIRWAKMIVSSNLNPLQKTLLTISWKI